MSHPRKIVGVFLGAILFFYNSQILAQIPQKTDKIKITSFFNVDNNWTFNLFDYANNKAIRLFNNESHAGYKIIAFNEITQTVTLSTPQGIFLVTLQNGTLQKNEICKAEESSLEELDFTKLSSNTVSRKQILDNIK